MMQYSTSTKRVFVQKFPAILAAAGLILSLSACTGSPFSTACVPVFPEGANTSAISADGRFGADPKATFPTPLVGAETEVGVLTSGDGAVVLPGSVVDFQVTAYNARNGDLFTSSSYTEAEPVRRTVIEADEILGQLTQCATVGSRLVSTTTAESLFGDTDLSQYNLTSDDVLVLVIDIQRNFMGKANGVDQLPQAGLPSIVLAPNGRPGFTFPTSPAPTDLVISTLKQGSGAVVEKGDHVAVHYSGVLWDAETLFDSSWERGVPGSFLAESLADDENGLVPGFAQALIGQRVGSQVLVVIPPEFGYPTGTAPDSVPDGSTMVFVFDVLGIE
jgi:FKBP-type peptidyl-prolyl cis-trans isomerase